MEWNLDHGIVISTMLEEIRWRPYSIESRNMVYQLNTANRWINVGPWTTVSWDRMVRSGYVLAAAEDVPDTEPYLGPAF